MDVEAGSHWMDRVRGAQPAARRYRSIPLLSNNQQSREAITTRTALRARQGLTQEELLLLARDRRRADLQARRPARTLLAIGCIAAGTAISVAGSSQGNQALLLAGFGIGLAGLLVACTILASLLDPQLGDLARYMHAEETPATADEITALSRAAQADPELGHLIAGWWKDSGAPIRRHDLALVQAFQQARRGH